MTFPKIVTLTHLGFEMRLVKYSVSNKSSKELVAYIIWVVKTSGAMVPGPSFLLSPKISFKIKQPLHSLDPRWQFGGILSVSVCESHSPRSADFPEAI